MLEAWPGTDGSFGPPLEMKRGTPCGIPHGASLPAQLCLCMYVWPGQGRMGRPGRFPCSFEVPGSVPCAIPLTTMKIYFNLFNLPDQRYVPAIPGFFRIFFGRKSNPAPSHNNILAAIWKRQVDLVSPGFGTLQQEPESAFQDVAAGATGLHHAPCCATFGVENIFGNLDFFSDATWTPRGGGGRMEA